MLKPEEIVAGEYYRCRDGKKAFVSAVDLPNPLGSFQRGYPVFGFRCNAGYSWTREGRTVEGKPDCPEDLVGVWVERAEVDIKSIGTPPEILLNGVLYRKAVS